MMECFFPSKHAFTNKGLRSLPVRNSARGMHSQTALSLVVVVDRTVHRRQWRIVLPLPLPLLSL
jgi:hypothetical protein